MILSDNDDNARFTTVILKSDQEFERCRFNKFKSTFFWSFLYVFKGTVVNRALPSHSKMSNLEKLDY